MKLTLRIILKSLVLVTLFVTDYKAQEIPRQVDDYMIAAVKAGKFSGAILVSQHDKVLLSKGYGFANLELDVPNTPQTKFRIGSNTKQFTAMAIMILQERAKLNVQDSICKYIPNCPKNWANITIHHLLIHTSGFSDTANLSEWETIKMLPSTIPKTVERFRDKPLDFKPGERFRYSNSGYVLLGYIIEQVTGRSWVDFIKDNIFTPLGMVNSGSDHPDVILKNRAAGYAKRDDIVINAQYLDMSNTEGGGSLYSTVEDMILWDQALSSEKLVSKKSLETIFNSYQISSWGDGVGYGWFIYKDKTGRKVIGHRGGINGFSAHIARCPEEKILVIVLSNYSFTPIDEISNDVLTILFKNRIDSK